MSSGNEEADEVLMTWEPLDVNAVFKGATLPSTGATSLFVGTTRDNFDGKKVVKLEYEAYEPMAIKELKSLCAEIREKWSVSKIVIHHRLGEVEITQPSVIIAVSAPHRKESLEAVNFGIERLKEKVPIWKKEKYEEGGEAWKENSECCWSNKVKRRRIAVDESKILMNANKTEIERRIAAFIKQKQEEKDRLNALEFCDRNLNSDDERDEGSARTVSKVCKKEGSKSHLRTSDIGKKVTTDCGGGEIVPESCPLDTRLREIEDRVFSASCSTAKIKPVSRDIYTRLKALEDRLLTVESASPEYTSLMNINQAVCRANGRPRSNSAAIYVEKISRQKAHRKNVLSALPNLEEQILSLQNKISNKIC